MASAGGPTTTGADTAAASPGGEMDTTATLLDVLRVLELLTSKFRFLKAYGKKEERQPKAKKGAAYDSDKSDDDDDAEAEEPAEGAGNNGAPAAAAAGGLKPAQIVERATLSRMYTEGEVAFGKYLAEFVSDDVGDFWARQLLQRILPMLLARIKAPSDHAAMRLMTDQLVVGRGACHTPMVYAAADCFLDGHDTVPSAMHALAANMAADPESDFANTQLLLIVIMLLSPHSNDHVRAIMGMLTKKKAPPPAMVDNDMPIDVLEGLPSGVRSVVVSVMTKRPLLEGNKKRNPAMRGPGGEECTVM